MVFRSRGDKIFDFINVCISVVVLLVIVYPLYFIVIASISDPNAVYQGRVWLAPLDVTFEGYQRIFRSDSIWLGYRNTIMYAFLGTSLNLSLTLPCAFSLSKPDLFGRKAIMIFIVLTMFFSGGMIPIYLTVRNFNMINTTRAMIVPNAVSAWNLIIARTFFQSNIPQELQDSGKIDGCSDFKFFFMIVLPLSKALVAIMALFYGVGHWNAFFNALIYLRSESRFPLQLILRNILIQNQISPEMLEDVSGMMAAQQNIADLIKYGMIIVSSVPLLILYPFLQKHFVKGVLIGSIKG